MKKAFNASSVKIESFVDATVYTGFLDTEHEGSLISNSPKHLNALFNQLNLPHDKRAPLETGEEFFFEASKNEKSRYTVKSTANSEGVMLTVKNNGRKRPIGMKPFVLIVPHGPRGLVMTIQRPAEKSNSLLGRQGRNETRFKL